MEPISYGAFFRNNFIMLCFKFLVCDANALFKQMLFIITQESCVMTIIIIDTKKKNVNIF